MTHHMHCAVSAAWGFSKTSRKQKLYSLREEDKRVVSLCGRKHLYNLMMPIHGSCLSAKTQFCPERNSCACDNVQPAYKLIVQAAVHLDFRAADHGNYYVDVCIVSRDVKFCCCRSHRLQLHTHLVYIRLEIITFF